MFNNKMSLVEFSNFVFRSPIVHSSGEYTRYQLQTKELGKIMPQEFKLLQKGRNYFGSYQKIYRHTPSKVFIVVEEFTSFVDVHQTDASYDRSLLIFSRKLT